MKKTVIIGSTGLVGKNLVDLLTDDKDYTNIYTIARSKPEHLSKEVIHIPFNSGNYELPATCDTAFCCLGTTMKKAGSKDAFKKVDLEMVVTFARKAKAAGVTRFAVVSSIGANPQSSNFYLKTKGEMEEQLKKVGFDRLVIVRPSLLLGKRNEKRLGEDLGKFFYSLFKFAFVGRLQKYKGIAAEEVAKAMIVLVENGMGTVIAESDALHGLSVAFDERSN